MPHEPHERWTGRDAAAVQATPAARPRLRREIATLFLLSLALQLPVPFLFDDGSDMPTVLGLLMLPSLLVGLIGGWLIAPRSASPFDRYILPGLIAFAAFASVFLLMLLTAVGMSGFAEADWSTLPLGVITATLALALAFYALLNQLAATCGALLWRLAWSAAHRDGAASS
jgi:hypothetical protein